MDPRAATWEQLWQFKHQNEWCKQLQLKRYMKKWCNLHGFNVSFLTFLEFCLDLSKKSETVSHRIIKNTIFLKSITRPWTCIHVSFFNRLKFLLRSAKNCKKCTFQTIKYQKQNGNMKTIFHVLFFTLTVCNIHFYIWKSSKFIFMWSSLWSILVCKTPYFWALTTNLASLSYFSREQAPWGY